MNNEPPARIVIRNFSDLKHKINNKWPNNTQQGDEIFMSTTDVVFWKHGGNNCYLCANYMHALAHAALVAQSLR